METNLRRPELSELLSRLWRRRFPSWPPVFILRTNRMNRRWTETGWDLRRSHSVFFYLFKLKRPPEETGRHLCEAARSSFEWPRDIWENPQSSFNNPRQLPLINIDPCRHKQSRAPRPPQILRINDLMKGSSSPSSSFHQTRLSNIVSPPHAPQLSVEQINISADRAFTRKTSAGNPVFTSYLQPC